MRLVRIIERLLAAIPVVVGVLIIVFFFMRLLPGDPARMMAGPDADAATIEMLRAQLGLARG